MAWFWYLATEKHYPAILLNEVSGGVASGAILGAGVGAFAGGVFGRVNGIEVSIPLIALAGVLGTMCIGLGPVVYGYRGNWRGAGPVLLISMAAVLIAIIAGFLVLQALGPVQAWPNVKQGARIGCLIGGIWGLQVGLMFYLYRYTHQTTSLP